MAADNAVEWSEWQQACLADWPWLLCILRQHLHRCQFQSKLRRSGLFDVQQSWWSCLFAYTNQPCRIERLPGRMEIIKDRDSWIYWAGWGGIKFNNNIHVGQTPLISLPLKFSTVMIEGSASPCSRSYALSSTKCSSGASSPWHPPSVVTTSSKGPRLWSSLHLHAGLFILILRTITKIILFFILQWTTIYH